jgi:hypothetical protein
MFGAAELLTMERQRPLQTLHNQLFRERLQIDMAACSATLVGLSAATPTYLEWSFALLLVNKWPNHIPTPSRTFLGIFFDHFK